MEQRTFICLNCGAKGIDTSRTKTKKFCNMHCNQAYYYKKKRGKTEIVPTFPCRYNWQVQCNRKKCSTCGWNPEVEAKRKEALANG